MATAAGSPPAPVDDSRSSPRRARADDRSNQQASKPAPTGSSTVGGSTGRELPADLPADAAVPASAPAGAPADLPKTGWLGDNYIKKSGWAGGQATTCHRRDGPVTDETDPGEGSGKAISAEEPIRLKEWYICTHHASQDRIQISLGGRRCDSDANWKSMFVEGLVTRNQVSTLPAYLHGNPSQLS